MSRFDDRNVGALVKRAYLIPVDASREIRRRAKETAPLLGKEVQLLAVLQSAEETYNEWLELGASLYQQQRLMSNFPKDCDTLTNHLSKVLDCWHAMRNYGGQYELACRIQDHAADVKAFIQRTDSAMQTLTDVLRGAQSGSDDMRFSYTGRPPGQSKSGASAVALLEFTKVVRAYWIENISKTFRFTETTLDHLDSRRFATSAAARLMEGAATLLDRRYTLGNVREAMEAAFKDPRPNPL
jgi:hypothetical protein